MENGKLLTTHIYLLKQKMQFKKIHYLVEMNN
jgi:hypothetical protein